MGQPALVVVDPAHNVPSTKVFGREPAVILAFISGAINFALALGLPWSVEQVSLVNAVVSALMAVAIAYYTKDSLLAVGLGLVQALLAVAVGFGLDVDTNTQAAFMAFLNVAVGLFNRQQTSPDPAPKIDLSETSAVAVAYEAKRAA